MCGIAGQIDLQCRPLERVHVSAMCELIAHRGPDDRGQWCEGPAALGHQRLSIIDLSARGRNPMPNEDGSIWLVFNGEIYNFRELRRELQAAGHVFRSGTDGEVILHLYEEEGPDCVARLNGMFAFALWDSERNRLLLARDRFGVKPLYYTVLGGELYFASEAKAFQAVPSFSAAVDPQALAEHLTFQNMFRDRTLFSGVKLLQAGHLLLAEGGKIQDRAFWDLQFAPEANASFDSLSEELRSTFEAAVRRQLVSDVAVGSFLSGGMDTGAISAVAMREIPRMHTFTCGFEIPGKASNLERYFDEREESRELARLLGTEHHELVLGSGAMAPALPPVAWHLDEPRVGISYQVFYTAELVRKYVKVVLSGVGGDELFAGYPWRYQGILDLPREAFDQAYYQRWVRLLSDDERDRLFTGSLREALGSFSTRDSYREVMRSAPSTDNLDRALYFDFKTFLNGLLVVDDKMSMAHSVETRVPFLDNELVDLVARIPSSFKYREGEGKRILRSAMKGLLPDATIERRKQGFTPPDETWFKTTSLPVIRDTLLGERALARGYFEPREVQRIVDAHMGGQANHRFLIWSLLCFEWWNRHFIDREPMPELAGGRT